MKGTGKTVTESVYIGIDPGPRTSGVVVYRQRGRLPGRVAEAYAEAELQQVRRMIADYSGRESSLEVVLECTQAGPPSTQVVKTTEVVGRIMEMCHSRGVIWSAYYRREVLQGLGCARKGNKDSLVRLACIELHGGDRKAAVGTKSKPGPLYGVSSHAWQALGVVCSHVLPFERPLTPGTPGNNHE